MDTYPPREISIIEPIGAAIDKTKEILFQPFDIGKWFAIGFCAWLATLGEGGSGGSFNAGSGEHAGGDFRQEFDHTKEVVLDNLPVVISIAAAVAVLIIVLSLVFMWLKSRGQFMFLHCVAENKGEVVRPWKQFAKQANSLFRFKLVLWLLGWVGSLVLIVPFVLIIISFAKKDFEVFAIPAVVLGIFLVLGFIGLIILFKIVATLTKDFVVPIMRLESCTVTEGWGRFWDLCKPNFGTFFLFLLFLIVVNIVLGMIAVAIIVGACCLCCVGIIFLIPYIGTVGLLPIYVWRRAYSALFLAQFGPEFDVFAQVEPFVVPTGTISPEPQTPDIPGSGTDF